MKAKPIVLALLIGVVLAPILLLLFSWKLVRENQGLRPGDILPEARLLSLEGSGIETLSWRGAPLLLVLFLPSCKACDTEITSLESIAPSFPGLKIVLLSLDSSLRTVDMPFPIVLDPSGEFVQKTRKAIVPTLYWINADGRVLYARTGPRAPEADAALFRELAEQSKIRSPRAEANSRNEDF